MIMRKYSNKEKGTLNNLFKRRVMKNSITEKSVRKKSLLLERARRVNKKKT